MKELVELITKSMVDYPEQIQVTLREQDDTLAIEIKAAKEDMGKVIGKQGRIAKAIRTVVKAAAIKSGKRVTIDILQ